MLLFGLFSGAIARNVLQKLAYQLVDLFAIPWPWSCHHAQYPSLMIDKERGRYAAYAVRRAESATLVMQRRECQFLTGDKLSDECHIGAV